MAWSIHLPKGILLKNLYSTRVNITSFYHSTACRNALKIHMPSLSPTMSEGTIVKWLKAEGESLNPGDVLCDIQTDKAIIALENEEEGVLAKILAPDDSKDVKVGTLIAVIAESGEDWQVVNKHAASTPTTESNPSKSTTSEPSSATVKHAASSHSLMGPAVRTLLQLYGLKASDLPGTGPRGVILKGDVLNYVKSNNLTPKPIAQVPLPAESKQSKEANVASFLNSVKSLKKSTPASQTGTSYADVELSNMRKTIAKRLTQSKTSIPHAYSSVDCRIDSILKLRKELKSDGVAVSVNDFVIKAVATALRLCPDVNVLWQNDQVVPLDTIDVSIAVATDSGLITPIVKDAADKGVQTISEVVKDLASRARVGKLQLNEFQGGSFTISNLGMHGVNAFSAIINPPQCGILAVGSSRLTLDENCVIQNQLNVTLSYDERAITPYAAVHFLAILKRLLETPQTLLLGSVGVAEAQAPSTDVW